MTYRTKVMIQGIFGTLLLAGALVATACGNFEFALLFIIARSVWKPSCCEVTKALED